MIAFRFTLMVDVVDELLVGRESDYYATAGLDVHPE